jgi:hypothetical protein
MTRPGLKLHSHQLGNTYKLKRTYRSTGASSLHCSQTNLTSGLFQSTREDKQAMCAHNLQFSHCTSSGSSPSGSCIPQPWHQTGDGEGEQKPGLSWLRFGLGEGLGKLSGLRRCGRSASVLISIWVISSSLAMGSKFKCDGILGVGLIPSLPSERMSITSD